MKEVGLFAGTAACIWVAILLLNAVVDPLFALHFYTCEDTRGKVYQGFAEYFDFKDGRHRIENVEGEYFAFEGVCEYIEIDKDQAHEIRKAVKRYD